jgi:hypothetical protein
MSKKYYPEYGSVIHPVEEATRKFGRNGDSHDVSYSQVLKSHNALHFDVFKGIVDFILTFLLLFAGWMTNQESESSQESQLD